MFSSSRFFHRTTQKIMNVVREASTSSNIPPDADAPSGAFLLLACMPLLATIGTAAGTHMNFHKKNVKNREADERGMQVGI